MKFGINIAGHINGDFGLAEGVRSSIRAIKAVDILHVLNNLHIPTVSNTDQTFTQFSEENPYPINLIQTNPNWLHSGINEGLFKVLNPDYFQSRYNVGFWLWELPKFPSEWEFAFDFFDEIWTMSNYCVEAISTVSPIPVLKMMPSLDLPEITISRQTLGLPTNQFIFLFMFDFGSSFERKNPIATIKAFRQAFGSSEQNVSLVVKFHNAELYPQQVAQLRAAIGHCSSIHVIDRHFLRDELNALVYHCDCYISLHRSEGFGFTMAEAMFYGKPVIATAYSSNIDFMNVRNSFLVQYDLITTTEDYGFYPKGSTWADPDVDHAASLMRYVFEHYDEAQTVGATAAQDIKLHLSPQAVGQRMKNRLEYIAQAVQVQDILEDKRWFGYQVTKWRQQAQNAQRELDRLQLEFGT
jgi:glycosyltransferase involved in cell wall biosynthesis